MSRLVVVCSAVEGMKVVEIEKCRNDIKKLREEMVSRNNRCVQPTQPPHASVR